MKKGIIVFLFISLLTVSCSFVPVPTSAAPTPTPFLPESWVPKAESTPLPPTSTPYPAFPTFGPPLEWPQSFDELWEFIETGHRGYTFETCLPGELTTPWITWDMLNEAVAAQTPERKHPYLEFYADDIARIIHPGRGWFPDEHRLVRVCEDSAFAQMALIELEGLADPTQPIFLACGDNNKKPIVHGGGIQKFLDWLAAQPIASGTCPTYSPPAPGPII